MIKVLFNNNDIVGLEEIDSLPDDNYTVMSVTLLKKEVMFVIFDNDIDVNVVNTEDDDFIQEVLLTFTLYDKALTSKPFSDYQH